MTHASFSFKRPQLAAALCDSLEGKGIANSRSGLFLAAPRRVGKSTFLKGELVPAGNARQWVTVYVDLWANREADPAELIAEAIKTRIADYQGKITKLAKAVKLDKIMLMGTLVLDFNRPGLPPSMTLADAIKVLHSLADQPVLLIVDEAQHALTTPAGLNAMFGLKSARDQLNSNDLAPALMLVFTGSNRDKLAHLVLKKDQPFFGSDVTPFPLLNRAYTDAFTDWANASLAADNQFGKDGVWSAFKLVGHRPEILNEMAGRIALGGEAANFSGLLEQNAELWHGRIWDEFESEFNTLTELQKAVLTALVEKGRAWSPFNEDSMTRYAEITRQKEVSTASVQTAIAGLRERGFIWQSGRGAYALEDESFAEWFRHGGAGEKVSG
ncbi:hypothetical protein FNU76_23225 [Chitinimonas arctica]|uniref:ATP-binding protein n=1 Tax=Chitinimonas arctica TaxID=2594795 RepID=A0A516SLK2_9NEIS|nr:hypothetical protein [Chitinimonas arctica]QDQ29023.1 hypothetical protein FNU76_23225 [Chitinimonas arctica]